MELIWTAFLLGLVGSLHCAAMCGPLILAVSTAGGARLPFVTSRVVYNAGRITMYGAIGLLSGAIGKAFVLTGFQRWLSISAGAAILIGLLLSSRGAAGTRMGKIVLKLKSAFGRVLQRRTLANQFVLGSLNGLLPCGLVYVAAAGAVTTSIPVTGVLYMVVFGVGTLPALLAISFGGRGVRFAARLYSGTVIRVSVLLVATLLLLRGMSLGIPYLSPVLGSSGNAVCHQSSDCH